MSSQSALGEENLADVSGGVNPKTAGVILSLLTIGSGVLSSAVNLASADTPDASAALESSYSEPTAVSQQNDAVLQAKAPEAPPAPPAPAPPPPPSMAAPAPVVSSKVSIPQGFFKTDMPESNEEIKKLIKIDLPEDFDEIKENCILLQHKKSGEKVIYNKSTDKIWAKDEVTNEYTWFKPTFYELNKRASSQARRSTEDIDKEREEKKKSEEAARKNFEEDLSQKDKMKIMQGKAEIYQKDDGTFAIRDVEIINDEQKSSPKVIKRDFSKKAKLDASKLDAPAALGMFSANVKALTDQKQEFIKLEEKGINTETTEQAKNMVAKFNEVLADLNASSGRILDLYTEAKKESSRSPVTLRSTLLKLREDYAKLSNEYNAILKIYSRFGLDAKSLGLADLPQSPLPLPKKIEFEGASFTYSDEENKLEISSKPGQKVVITLELLKELGVKDFDKYSGKPVVIELAKNYELDEDCSRLLELKLDSNGVSGFVKRSNTPPLEDVFDAMDKGNEKLKELIGNLPVYSNSTATYNAKPEAKKVTVEAVDSKALLNWQKDQNGNLTAKKGRSTVTYNVSAGLFEVKGSPVILEQEDINNIESITGKRLEKIEYKIKGKIILGQSLLNAGWQDSTGYFFGNYSYSRISDNVKLTSVEDVIMYKYTDGSVYILDNRDDKSQPIVLNEDDLNKVETEFGSTRIWSRSKIEVTGSNWTKHNSFRYYGFEKK